MDEERRKLEFKAVWAYGMWLRTPPGKMRDAYAAKARKAKQAIKRLQEVRDSDSSK